MSYGSYQAAGSSEFDAGRAWRWLFALGFAEEQANQRDTEQRGALEDCGAVIQWVVPIVVFLWAQVYDLGFFPMLGLLEIQAVIIGVVTALFVPRRSLKTVLNITVNVMLAMLAAFLVLLAASFAIGFILLILSEAE